MDPELEKLLNELKAGIKAVPEAVVKIAALEAKIENLALKGQAVDGLRRDVDDAWEKVRELERRGLRLAAAGPAFTGDVLPNGHRRMRFSHPDLAKDFFEFCRKVRSQDKALSPVADATGGYTIPGPELAGEIDRMVEMVGVARRIAGEVPLPAGGLKRARRLGGAVVYWKAPGAAGTKSTPEFGQYELSAETLIALVDADFEYEEDTAVATGNFLATEFAYSMAAEEDRVCFVGTGIPADGGIVGILNSDRVTVVDMAATKTTFASLLYGNVVDLEAAVWEAGLDESLFVMHRSVKAVIKKLLDTSGQPIWQPASVGEPSNIIGYGHATSGKMRGTAATAVSTTFMAFGNFRVGLKFGARGPLRIDYSDAPGWANLQRCWRAFERIDACVNGFTAAEIAAHPELANPIAVLKTAAS